MIHETYNTDISQLIQMRILTLFKYNNILSWVLVRYSPAKMIDGRSQGGIESHSFYHALRIEGLIFAWIYFRGFESNRENKSPRNF